MLTKNNKRNIKIALKTIETTKSPENVTRQIQNIQHVLDQAKTQTSEDVKALNLKARND